MSGPATAKIVPTFPFAPAINTFIYWVVLVFGSVGKYGLEGNLHPMRNGIRSSGDFVRPHSLQNLYRYPL